MDEAIERAIAHANALTFGTHCGCGEEIPATYAPEEIVRQLDKAGFAIVPKEPTEAMDSDDELMQEIGRDYWPKGKQFARAHNAATLVFGGYEQSAEVFSKNWLDVLRIPNLGPPSVAALGAMLDHLGLIKCERAVKPMHSDFWRHYAIAAKAIEAGTAETGTGSVHESAVAESDLP